MIMSLQKANRFYPPVFKTSAICNFKLIYTFKVGMAQECRSCTVLIADIIEPTMF